MFVKKRNSRQEETFNNNCRNLPVLRTRKVQMAERKIDKKNMIVAPAFPIYDKETNDFFDKFNELHLGDPLYAKHFEKMRKRKKLNDINDLNRDETLTWLTYIIRGEGFCSGTFKDALESGLVESLCIRLHKTVEL